MRRYTENKDAYKKYNNDRMRVRDMSNATLRKITGMNDHHENLNRLLLEREDIFNKDSKFDLEVDNMGRPQMGEITGDNFEFGEGEDDRGLPVRSQYTIKKPVYDENEHLDFDLFDKRPSKLNVKSFDPSSGASGGAGYADISTSMSKISTQVNPLAICSSQIDRLNNNLFYHMFDLMEDNNYGINGIGLFNLFASLYLSSSGITEIELKKFFEFPKKEQLYKGLLKINSALSNVEKMVNVKNFMIVGRDVPYEPKYYNALRKFCILLEANTLDIENEYMKINHLIKKMMGQDMRNIITPDNLHNLQLMIATTTIIHPIWGSPFDRITKGVFHGDKYSEKIGFLHSIGKSFGYFEDNDHQLLEIKCASNELVMGILLHKDRVVPDVDDVKLHFYISHMKESVLEEVKIPVFKQDIKLRFNNTLQKLGLKSVFVKMIAPDFFPEGVVLHDVIQNVRIVVDELAIKHDAFESRGHRTIRKFVADKPFIFYFRLTRTDTIIFIGIKH